MRNTLVESAIGKKQEWRKKRASAKSPKPASLLFSGQGQNRTADTGIFSLVLYQLSYLAASRREPLTFSV